MSRKRQKETGSCLANAHDALFKKELNQELMLCSASKDKDHARYFRGSLQL
jgi:hypothetical protein